VHLFTRTLWSPRMDYSYNSPTGLMFVSRVVVHADGEPYRCSRELAVAERLILLGRKKGFLRRSVGEKFASSLIGDHPTQ
jgi:hypothetical protein